MADEIGPSEQAEHELILRGRPRPRGNARSRCVIDALIVLTAALPLELYLGHGDESERAVVIAVMLGVGLVSYTIRRFHEEGWYRDHSRRVTEIIEQRVLREEQRREA